MIVGLASPRIATTLEDGLARVERLLTDAAAQGAQIVCFPEAYLPGLRGQDFEVVPFGENEQERVLRTVGQWARARRVARSEEHTSELQSQSNIVCRLLLEKKII